MRLIDADYILSALNVFSDREHGNEHFLFGIETAQEIVKDAPTITPESLRTHGKWYDKTPIIWHGISNIPVVQCSECEITFCDIINNHHYMYRYCPHCGARMDKEVNDDD